MGSEMRILEMALEHEREIAEIRRRRLAQHRTVTSDRPGRRSWWPWRKPRQARQPATQHISEPA